MEEKLTINNWGDDNVNQLISQLSDSLDVIKWAYKEFEENIVYACRFGMEAKVLIDLISKVTTHAKIIW